MLELNAWNHKTQSRKLTFPATEQEALVEMSRLAGYDATLKIKGKYLQWDGEVFK
jgi:hypothetical protein